MHLLKLGDFLWMAVEEVNFRGIRKEKGPIKSGPFYLLAKGD